MKFSDLNEFAFVDAITAGFDRSPDQLNRRHEADCELVRLPGGDLLAVTVDGLTEEYTLGILRDPEAVGWSVVVHSLSDLAACAARPVGVLLSYNLPEGSDPEWAVALNRGADAALRAHGTFCLGGDTSFASEASFHCVGVGLVESDDPLTRVGAQAGDLVYATGPLGMGNVLGLGAAMDPDTHDRCEPLYRPRVRFDLVSRAREMIRAAIDTSDGLIAALDLLMRANGLGLHFEQRDEVWCDPLREMSAALGTPLWVGGAFGMGEYEMLLVVPPAQSGDFEAAMAELEVPGVRVGEFVAEGGLTMDLAGRVVSVDSTRLLNLFSEAADVRAYVEALFAFDSELGSHPSGHP